MTAGGAVVWNARSGAQIAAVPAAAKEGGGAGCTSCAFDHSGRLLVVGTTDGRMLCYQAATGALVAELAGGHGPRGGAGRARAGLRLQRPGAVHCGRRRRCASLAGSSRVGQALLNCIHVGGCYAATNFLICYLRDG